MDDRAARANARRGRVTITKKRLGESDDEVVRGPEALSLVYQLTRSSWAWADKPLPKLPRSELPFRFIPGQRT